jgi:ubiquinol-cytochrome c reductase cytochrome b subunit
MFSALVVLIPLSFIHTLNLRSNRFRPVFKLLFWIFVFNFLFLLVLGAKPIAQPYTMLGQISTVVYFSYFIILMLIG